jgi:hypothetical protein
VLSFCTHLFVIHGQPFVTFTNGQQAGTTCTTTAVAFVGLGQCRCQVTKVSDEHNLTMRGVDALLATSARRGWKLPCSFQCSILVASPDGTNERVYMLQYIIYQSIGAECSCSSAGPWLAATQKLAESGCKLTLTV